MKTSNYLNVLLIVLSIFVFQTKSNAQESATSGFQVRVKGGIGQTFIAMPKTFDDVTIKNPMRAITTTKSNLDNTFLRTQWGPYGGINMDLYLQPKFGFGLDGDIFFNKLQFVIPERLEGFMDEMDIDSLVEGNRNDQCFFFAGIGPAFKLLKSEHWDIDLNFRAGLSMLQMGSLDVSLPDLETNATFAGAILRPEILQYDYSTRKLALGAKAGVYVNYWFNSWIGVTAGADLVHSFVSAEKLMDNGSYTVKYKDPHFFNTNELEAFDKEAYFFMNNELDDYPAGKMNVNHFGVSAGLVFRIGGVIGGQNQVKETPRFTLSGLAVECDDNSKPLGNVLVELTNSRNGKVIKTYSSANGKFFFTLEPDADYTVNGTYNMYKSEVREISTKGLTESETLDVVINLCLDLLVVGKTFVIKNIYYDFDKCDFREDAVVELDRLVKTMEVYPGMEIELSAHTDQRGDDDYNKRLSQCRAESVMNYLVSKGIDRSRIIPVGFGETRLMKDCTNEPGCGQTGDTDCPCHQNNRRTEVKILKL